MPADLKQTPLFPVEPPGGGREEQESAGDGGGVDGRWGWGGIEHDPPEPSPKLPLTELCIPADTVSPP